MSLPEVNGLKKYLHHSCKMRIVSKYFSVYFRNACAKMPKRKGKFRIIRSS